MTIGRIPSVEGGIQPTIFDAKADLLTATAADTPARLAVGNDGETLVADSSATTGLRWTATPSASNPILNSSFQVWQRGTSIALTTTAYTADRWQGYRAVAGSTVSRQTTSDTTNLANVQYCARVQRDSGNTSTSKIYISQSLESINSIPFAGKAITLSFYARAGANYSSASSNLDVALRSGTGTDQNVTTAGYTGSANVVSTSQAITTTWVRYSFTGTVATSATELGVELSFTPVGTAGAADYFEFTGVQIDIGSVALPFRTYSGTLAGELAAASRYYYRFAASSTYSVFGAGNAYSTTGITAQFPLPVSMRVAPTSVDYSNIGVTQNFGGGTASISAVSLNSAYQSTSAAHPTITSTGLTSGTNYFIGANNNSAGYIGFSAEL